MIFIGLDDTDVIGSPGTGHLARMIADDLAADFTIVGVVRHQLLVDPRIPYTAKNSSAAILVDADSPVPDGLFHHVRRMMLANFIEGSDPGLALAVDVDEAVMAFGQRVKTAVVTLSEATTLAGKHRIRLAGLGGTNGGIIGALASVGLAASGNDGRYIRVGTIRDISGLQPIEVLHGAGIDRIQTMNQQQVNSGLVLAENLRPSRRNHRPVLFVEMSPEGYWHPLKLD